MAPDRKRKWIVTGGAGFIGCHAASRFHRAGHHVVVVDNLSRSGGRREPGLAPRARGHRLRQGSTSATPRPSTTSSRPTPTPTPCCISPARSP